MTGVDFTKLEAGEKADREIYELIFGETPKAGERTPFTTSASLLPPVMQWCSIKARYFGLMRSEKGFWVAMAAESSKLLGHFEMEGDDGGQYVDCLTSKPDQAIHDAPAVRSVAYTPMLAVCGLALAIGEMERLAEAKAGLNAANPRFEWVGESGFSD